MDTETIIKVNKEEEAMVKAGCYNWHHQDLLDNPPYSHYDMVVMLNDGKFIIEGKPSNWDYAVMYADHHSGSPKVWEALEHIENYSHQLALGEIPY